ncbi:DUF397 domain-containing protein [Actinoallomurus sp. NPDC052308]
MLYASDNTELTWRKSVRSTDKGACVEVAIALSRHQ